MVPPRAPHPRPRRPAAHQLRGEIPRRGETDLRGSLSEVMQCLTIQSVRILGVAPGSVHSGCGVIDYDRGRLALVEQGTIATQRGADLADRLCRIHEELTVIIARTMPAVVA